MPERVTHISRRQRTNIRIAGNCRFDVGVEVAEVFVPESGLKAEIALARGQIRIEQPHASVSTVRLRAKARVWSLF